MFYLSVSLSLYLLSFNQCFIKYIRGPFEAAIPRNWQLTFFFFPSRILKSDELKDEVYEVDTDADQVDEVRKCILRESDHSNSFQTWSFLEVLTLVWRRFKSCVLWCRVECYVDTTMPCWMLRRYSCFGVACCLLFSGSVQYKKYSHFLDFWGLKMEILSSSTAPLMVYHLTWLITISQKTCILILIITYHHCPSTVRSCW